MKTDRNRRHCEFTLTFGAGSFELTQKTHRCESRHDERASGDRSAQSIEPRTPSGHPAEAMADAITAPPVQPARRAPQNILSPAPQSTHRNRHPCPQQPSQAGNHGNVVLAADQIRVQRKLARDFVAESPGSFKQNDLRRPTLSSVACKLTSNVSAHLPGIE